MPKVSVYLPDALYDAVRKHDISVSAVVQRALQDELRRQMNTEWVARVRSRKPRTTARIDTSALMDEVREEFGS